MRPLAARRAARRIRGMVVGARRGDGRMRRALASAAAAVVLLVALVLGAARLVR